MESSEIVETLERAYFAEHPPEEEVLRHLPPLLSETRHFVDIGASLGQYTRYVNNILSGARIDAIEADPVRFERLRENCKKWSGRNSIAVHFLAIADHAGEVVFHTTQSNVSGGLHKHELAHLDAENRARVDWAEVRVPAASLDGLFPVAPDFVKMDIEGGEWDALSGAKRILAERRTTWLIELHDFGGAKPADVIQLMKSMGYSADELAPQRVLFAPLTLGERVGAQVRRVGRRIKRLVRPR